MSKFKTKQELAKNIAVNALNYEMSDWGISWRVVDYYNDKDDDSQTFYMESSNGFDITLRVSSMRPSENSDYDCDSDTNWIWAADFAVICPNSDSAYSCEFWTEGVKWVWIMCLSESGWKD